MSSNRTASDVSEPSGLGLPSLAVPMQVVAGVGPIEPRSADEKDGNFVVVTSSGAVVWASNTAGGSGETVDMNANGDLWVGNKQITYGRCPKY